MAADCTAAATPYSVLALILVLQIIVCERSLAASTEQQVAKLLKMSTWRVTKYLLSENGTGVAPIFILFHAVLALGLIWLPYQILVESAILQVGALLHTGVPGVPCRPVGVVPAAFGMSCLGRTVAPFAVLTLQ